jgi:uncharacterized protein (TIGR02246 family)
MNDHKLVKSLYESLLNYWNKADAKAYASLFSADANIIGFDGSQSDGRQEILDHLSNIFANHKTGIYVSSIQQIRNVTSSVVMLKAFAGLIPAGQNDINPDINAIQTMIAVKMSDQWWISIFQNTPAAFHGRPELKIAMTNELKEAFNRSKPH